MLPENVVLQAPNRFSNWPSPDHFANGGVRDLSSPAPWRVADPTVVGVEPGGLLVAGKMGAPKLPSR